jgi:surfactin synthase thioesterase subunit
MSKSVPVHLAGWSYGGVVAFEIAQELLKSGHSPASLMFVAVDTHLFFSSFSRHHRMFDAPLGQHLRASTSPVEHRLRDMHLVSQSSTFHHITVFSLYTGNP